MPLKSEKVPPEGGTRPVGVKLSDKNAAAGGEENTRPTDTGQLVSLPPLALSHTLTDCIGLRLLSDGLPFRPGTNFLFFFYSNSSRFFVA
jgi:hypothetical protein